jgi:hypothetical protein
MKKAWFKVSVEAFREAMAIPDDCEIEHITWNYKENTLEIVVRGEMFQEVLEGRLIPQIYPNVTSEQAIIKKHWDWNLK